MGAAGVPPVLYEIQFSSLPFSSFETIERDRRSGAGRRGAGALWWLEGGSAGCAAPLCLLPTPSRLKTGTGLWPGGWGPLLILVTTRDSLTLEGLPLASYFGDRTGSEGKSPQWDADDKKTDGVITLPLYKMENKKVLPLVLL